MNDVVKEALINKIMAVAKKEIRIKYKKSGTGLSVQNSKIGGKPAVPHDFVWPYYTGAVIGEEVEKTRPLSFLAQINQKDITDLDEENVLPKTGILSFFYELETMTWGFDPKDRGSARVYYFQDESDLDQAEYPFDLEDYAKIPELEIEFEQHISVPSIEQFDDGNDYEWDDYYDCCNECGYKDDAGGDYTKLLGFPDIIQNPMEEECETVIRGFYTGDSEGYAGISEVEKADITAKSTDWMMLFQMSTITVEDYELMFGDCGSIYFWIKKSDLNNCNFDNTWLILQCF